VKLGMATGDVLRVLVTPGPIARWPMVDDRQPDMWLSFGWLIRRSPTSEWAASANNGDWPRRVQRAGVPLVWTSSTNALSCNDASNIRLWQVMPAVAPHKITCKCGPCNRNGGSRHHARVGGAGVSGGTSVSNRHQWGHKAHARTSRSVN
jgi:hypothetical protein